MISDMCSPGSRGADPAPDAGGVEDSCDRGVPRVNTLFLRRTATRSRATGGGACGQTYRQYQLLRNDPFWCTHQGHLLPNLEGLEKVETLISQRKLVHLSTTNSRQSGHTFRHAAFQGKNVFHCNRAYPPPVATALNKQPKAVRHVVVTGGRMSPGSRRQRGHTDLVSSSGATPRHQTKSGWASHGRRAAG